MKTWTLVFLDSIVSLNFKIEAANEAEALQSFCSKFVQVCKFIKENNSGIKFLCPTCNIRRSGKFCRECGNSLVREDDNALLDEDISAAIYNMLDGIFCFKEAYTIFRDLGLDMPSFIDYEHVVIIDESLLNTIVNYLEADDKTKYFDELPVKKLSL